MEIKDIKISVALPIKSTMLNVLTPFFNIINFLKQHFSENEIRLVFERSCTDTALLELSGKMRQYMGFHDDNLFRCMGWLKLISLIYWDTSTEKSVIMKICWHDQGYLFEPVTMQTFASFFDFISPYVEEKTETLGSINFRNNEGVIKTKSLVFVNEYLNF